MNNHKYIKNNKYNNRNKNDHLSYPCTLGFFDTSFQTHCVKEINDYLNKIEPAEKTRKLTTLVSRYHNNI